MRTTRTQLSPPVELSDTRPTYTRRRVGMLLAGAVGTPLAAMQEEVETWAGDSLQPAARALGEAFNTWVKLRAKNQREFHGTVLDMSEVAAWKKVVAAFSRLRKDAEKDYKSQ